MNGGSMFFDDLLDAKVREFNPRYADASGALLGQFPHLQTATDGNEASLSPQENFNLLNRNG